jgi:hypothetical protein
MPLELSDTLNKARDVALEQTRRLMDRVARMRLVRAILAALLIGITLQHSFEPAQWHKGKQELGTWLQQSAHSDARFLATPYWTLSLSHEATRKRLSARLGKVAAYASADSEDVVADIINRKIPFAIAQLLRVQRIVQAPTMTQVSDLHVAWAESGDTKNPRVLVRPDSLLGLVDSALLASTSSAPSVDAVRSAVAGYRDLLIGIQRDARSLDQSWQTWGGWTKWEWERIADSDYVGWRRAVDDIGAHEVIASDEVMHESVQQVLARIEKSLDDLQGAEQRAREKVSISGLDVFIPVEIIVLLFPFAYLITVGVLRLLNAQIRVGLIRVAQLEHELDACMGDDPHRPDLTHVVGREVLNTRSDASYIRHREWAKLVENNPNFFSDLLTSVLTLGLAAFLILWPWRTLVFHRFGPVYGWIPWLCIAVLVAFVVLAERSTRRMARELIAEALAKAPSRVE